MKGDEMKALGYSLNGFSRKQLPRLQKIMDYVATHPNASSVEIRKIYDCAPPTIRGLLNKFVFLGLMEITNPGKEKFNKPNRYKVVPGAKLDDVVIEIESKTKLEIFDSPRFDFTGIDSVMGLKPLILGSPRIIEFGDHPRKQIDPVRVLSPWRRDYRGVCNGY